MYILFDIGGTNMRLASSRDGKRIYAIEKRKTPKSFNEGMDLFKVMKQALIGDQQIKGIFGGIAGPLGSEKRRLVQTPNIASDWKGKDIIASLKKIFHCPVHIENDTALAGLGEAIYGAGRGKDIVAYMTISTGVGGVRIVNKKIDKSVFGFEPGHQILSINGKIRTLEQLVQGKAIRERTGRSPEDVHNKKFWKEIAKILSYGVHNVSVLWSPSSIIFGGGVMKHIPIRDVQKYTKQHLEIFGGRVPKIQRAQLGDDNGLYGALALLQQYKQK